MSDERYSSWDAYFEESNQDEFKKELKDWLRANKAAIQRYCEARGIDVSALSLYGMLAALLEVSLSSINNWMSLKAQKQIPDDRLSEIKRIMAEVGQGGEAASAESHVAVAPVSNEEFVKLFKSRLTYEAIGKFYTEAEKAGKTLDAYLLSLLK